MLPNARLIALSATRSSARSRTTSTRSRSAASRSRSRRRSTGRTSGCAASSSTCCATRPTSATPGGTTRTSRADATRSSSSAGRSLSAGPTPGAAQPTSLPRHRRHLRRVLDFSGLRPQELDSYPRIFDARLRRYGSGNARPPRGAVRRAESPARSAARPRPSLVGEKRPGNLRPAAGATTMEGCCPFSDAGTRRFLRGRVLLVPGVSPRGR